MMSGLQRKLTIQLILILRHNHQAYEMVAFMDVRCGVICLILVLTTVTSALAGGAGNNRYLYIQLAIRFL